MPYLGGHMQSVFVLGSAVSRDALDFGADTIDVAEYLAHTSLASIGVVPVRDASIRSNIARVAMASRRRMLSNDLDKTTLAILGSTPHDWLLMDFFDERFGLVLSGDSFFSHSPELQQLGVLLDGRAVLSPDSESFLSLWQLGLSRLLSVIEPAKVILNRAYWAERLPDGTNAASIGWIRRNNAVLQRLYDTVDRYWSLKCIDYPPGVIVADPKHRWGAAPYHYVPEFYQHALREIKSLIEK